MENIASTNKPLAVVTGASSGIGLELAKEFASNGFDLIIAAEDAGIYRVVPTLEKDGIRVQAIIADLATFEGNESLFNTIQSNRRPVAAIAINAGVGVHGDFVRENSLEDHLNLIRLNVISPVHLAKKVGAEMVREGNGKILFTSSIASQMPGTFMATYNASKAFVESFAEAIRAELKDTGVTVTTLLPGPTETEFFHRAHMDDTEVGEGKKDDAAEVAREGFKAMMDGKDHVVAGSFLNKVQATVAKVLPDVLKAQLHKKQAEPKSGSQKH